MRCSCVQAVAVVWLLCAALPLLQVHGAPPLVGADGYAAYFDHRRADVISFALDTAAPSDEVTVEYWYKNVDPYVHTQLTPIESHLLTALWCDGARFMTYQTVVSYGAYDLSVNPPIAQGASLSVYNSPYYTSMVTPTAASRCV
jgi:hypothetical protein